MPRYMGTLALSDATEVTTAADDIAVINTVVPETIEKSTALAAPEAADGVTWKPNKDKRIKTDQSIALENLTYGYKKPNILDAKLGVRLWADDAPAEKRRRFDTISSETTHRDHGCRIAGMRIYKGSEDPAELDQDGYRIYDRDYGRVAVTNENFKDEVRKFVFNKTAGIDEALGKAVCRGFVDQLKKVVEVLEAHRTRMYSSSILFVYEGDGEMLEEAIVRNNAMADERAADNIAADIVEVKVPDTVRFDSGIGMDGEDLDGGVLVGEVPTGEVSVGECLNCEDWDGEDSDDDEKPKIFTLKLIDCAHAKWVTEEDGADENTLKGVRSLLGIFKELSGEKSSE